ncbi:sporulation histidine kinase inhibitor Sda [Niallia sp. XMNu-256]
MKGLRNLSDYDLIVAYEKAVELNLDRDFTEILLVEIKNRGIRTLEPSIF